MRLFTLLLVLSLISLHAAGEEPAVLQSARAAWKPGDAAPVVPALQKAITVAVKLKDLKAPGDLIQWKGKTDRPPFRLFIGDVKGKPALAVEFNTEARSRPLQLYVPADLIGAGVPHEIVVRFLGHRLELFADGVLVDEEWPMGAILPAATSMAIGGTVTRLALWDRALSDDELHSLTGGREGLAQRESRYFGPEQPIRQFWQPRQFNTFVGDCMPFFHDGRFHLFYLMDRRHHQSKWRLGAHQWAHASTADLVKWDHHPMAVPITDESEGSICTGSTFFHDGVYYAFYAVRQADGSPAPLHAATSTDGIHFTKGPAFARLGAPYTGASARDPVVFREKATGLFHMLLCTSLQDPPIARRGGCLAHLVSRDLKAWEQREPFLVPGYPGEPECPDYFEWRGWYYLVFSNQGVARYRMSKNPMGPWLRPAVDVFDAAQASVLKTAAFNGDRRIGAAFLGAGGYAGQVVFREVFQHPDGTLGTKWPAELLPPTGAAKSLPAIKVSAMGGFANQSITTTPREFFLRARVKPTPGSSYFGLRFGAGEKMAGGYELRFEPLRDKVGLRPPDASSRDESADMSLYNVTGLDRPFNIELLVKGDIVDVCIDARRTIVARLVTTENNLFAFAQTGEVEFENIQLSPLAPR